MKKFGFIVIALALIIGVVGCSSGGETTTLKVGASPVPHAEILEFVKPLLLEEGINLQIVEYDDYIQPNLNLRDGEIHANYFQHAPYLERFSSDYGLDLVAVAAVHIEPMGIYSDKFDDLESVTQGSKVLIPGDPTNAGRALALLEGAGLLTLTQGVGVAATPLDIVDNPLNLDIVEMDAPFIANALPDAGLAIINTNFAIQGGLVPTEDALYIEGGDSPFANLLVVNRGDEDNEMIKKLAEILTSEAVSQFILDKYQGEVVPAN